jgi:hypothetical protein
MLVTSSVLSPALAGYLRALVHSCFVGAYQNKAKASPNCIELASTNRWQID